MSSGIVGSQTSMNLKEWNSRLQQHFEELRRQRLAAAGDKPIFVLEHGLGARDLQDLTTEIRLHIVASPPDDGHELPWIVYAAELGYRYSGDEYWQTFEEETPGWLAHGDRYWIRRGFQRFHKQLGGAKPSGPWAELQRSPELTQGCSPEVDHPEFPPMTRASVDAHEASLPHLPSLVCAGPARRPSPARLFSRGVSDRAARTDAVFLASA